MVAFLAAPFLALGVLGVLGVLGAAFLDTDGEAGVEEAPAAPAAGEAAAVEVAVFFFFHL